MTELKYFNVYQHSNLATLQSDVVFIHTDENYKDRPSKTHRTITGPFDSIDEARKSYASHGAKGDFLSTIIVPFDLP